MKLFWCILQCITTPAFLSPIWERKLFKGMDDTRHPLYCADLAPTNFGLYEMLERLCSNRNLVSSDFYYQEHIIEYCCYLKVSEVYVKSNGEWLLGIWFIVFLLNKVILPDGVCLTTVKTFFVANLITNRFGNNLCFYCQTGIFFKKRWSYTF